MDTTPKILYFVAVDYYFLSHRLPVAQAARDAGFEVVVATRITDPDNRRAMEAEGFEVVPLRTINRRGTNPVREAVTLAEVAWVYARVRPDIVHQVATKPVLYGGLAARLLGVPAVVNAVAGLGSVFVDDGSFSPVRKVLEAGYRAAMGHRGQRTIFQNPDDRQLMVDHGLVDPEDTVLIRGSGVDPSRFEVARQDDGPPRIVFGARMIEEKGPRVLYEAACILGERGVDCRIELYGEPDPESDQSVSEAELRAFSEHPLVEWKGFTDRMSQVLQQAHIACLPSYYREGLPKFLLEAASCSLPIVTCDNVGCREIVTDGDNGYLVPPRQAEPVADRLQELIEDPTLRRRLGQRGRQRIIDELSVEHVVKETLALYEEALAAAADDATRPVAVPEARRRRTASTARRTTETPRPAGQPAASRSQ